ncbi:hypothetical protein Sango_0252300 [Sesamum angolense]|uniref:Transposase-associated domain-containing protein n=1 Tax=Sesamum angolense TaxID=2727404 RepID=A0AAE1XI45_9LAMI|nr:hypothetical protein Sango_0252300 [Sesamum angolense]
MYEKNQKGNIVVWQEFENGVRDFINWAKYQHAHMNDDKIRCPCRKCKNRKFKTTDVVMYGICMKGFVDGYYNWTAHAEGASSSFPTGASSYDYDVSGLSEQFFDVVQEADNPLYSGCDQSQLAAVARLVNIKAEHNMSERCYDQKDDIDMEYCKFCGDPMYKPTRDRNPHLKKSLYAVLRYLPLTPRLQRLYTSPATADHITWHASHLTEEDSICHPSDAEVWRHFD